MQSGLRVPNLAWQTLSRSVLLTLAFVLVLSTQFLSQIELYEVWPLGDILEGWLYYLGDLATVAACILGMSAIAAILPTKTGTGRHATVLVGVALGAAIGEWLLMQRAPLPPDVAAQVVLFARTARWVVLVGLIYGVYVFQRRAAQAAAQTHESGLRRAQLERQMAEARLQALRAQIEPHFLFNTLANIHELHRTDHGRGRRMLANFVAYLRAAVPLFRGDGTTLRHELDLARAYLEVLQVRIGQRLAFRIDVPDALRDLPFPPYALATLTENAIKHGINPLPEGGSVEITGRIEDDRLKLVVADTGAGINKAGGSGSGLANLRARLLAQYGAGASLMIEGNVPRGIRVTIAIPASTH